MHIWWIPICLLDEVLYKGFMRHKAQSVAQSLRVPEQALLIVAHLM